MSDGAMHPGCFRHIAFWVFQAHCILGVSDALHSGCFRRIAFWVFQCILGVSDAAEDLGLFPTRGPEGSLTMQCILGVSMHSG